MPAQKNPDIGQIKENSKKRSETGTEIEVTVNGLDVWDSSYIELEVSGKESAGATLASDQYQTQFNEGNGWTITLQNLKPGETWTIRAELKLKSGGTSVDSERLEVSTLKPKPTPTPNPSTSPSTSPSNTPTAAVSYLQNWLDLTPMIVESKPIWPHLTPLIELPATLTNDTLTNRPYLPAQINLFVGGYHKPFTNRLEVQENLPRL